MSDTSSSNNALPSGGSEAAAQVRATILAFRRNLLLLRSSLFLGDIPTAREAFAALQSLGPGPSKRVPMSTTEVSTGASAYVALTQALEDGRLFDARQALARLLACMRLHPPTRRRHQRCPSEAESSKETLLLCLEKGAQRSFS